MATGPAMKTSEESSRATARDESLSPVGIAVMLILGASVAIAPRLGWDSSSYGLDTFMCAFLATLVVTGITFVARRDAGSDTFRGSSAHRSAPQPDAAGCQASSAPRGSSSARQGCPPQAETQDASAEQVAPRKANSTAEAAAVALDAIRARLDSVSRTAPPGDSSDEDPVWNTDWTTLRPPPGQPAEVFEMNDTPTWLARLQHRRNQAERAGKKKLVQKIDKEIAEATAQVEAALKARSSTKDPAGKPGATCAAESSSGQAGSHEDVWSMDWAAWSPKEDQLPAVAVA